MPPKRASREPTPVRVTRAAAKEETAPAVQKTAASYGSRGKLDMQKQMASTSANVDDLFATQTPSRRKGKEPATPAVPEEDEDDEEEEEVEEDLPEDDEVDQDLDAGDEEETQAKESNLTTTKRVTKSTTSLNPATAPAASTRSTSKTLRTSNPVLRRAERAAREVGLGAQQHTPLDSDAERQSLYSEDHRGSPEPTQFSRIFGNKLSTQTSKFSKPPAQNITTSATMRSKASAGAGASSARPPVPLFSQPQKATHRSPQRAPTEEPLRTIERSASPSPESTGRRARSASRSRTRGNQPWWNEPGFTWWIFKWTVITTFIASMAISLENSYLLNTPGPKWIVEGREKILTKTLLHDIVPESWNPIHHHYINSLLSTRVTKVEQDMKELQGRVSLQEEGLAALKDALPDHLVVRRTKDGWHIPPEFWLAMAERMSQDDAAPLWAEWIDANKARLDRLNEGGLNVINAATAWNVDEKVTPDMFIRLINDNNDVMRQNFKELLNDAQRIILTDANKLASDVADIAVRKSPTYQLARLQVSALGYANYVHNAHAAMASTNWLADGQAARVDPYLTSPTMNPNAFSFSNAASWLFWKLTGVPKLLPPIAALQDWSEAGSCWCAAPSSSSGGAQLAIILAQRVIPEEFVIEHVPATGTQDIAAAPRRVELWAEVASAAEAQAFTDAIRERTSQRDDNQCGPAPGKKFVCLGLGDYDLHLDNWVQYFPTFVDARELGLSTRKVVVRAASNWGQRYTCFYRVRMTGAVVSPRSQEPPEELEGVDEVV